MAAMSAYGAAVEAQALPQRAIGLGVKRLVLAYVWVTIASGAVVFSEPALYDLLMLGAAVVLPVAGMVSLSRGLALYLLLWAAIVSFGFVATTQAGILDVPSTHTGITLYLALTSAVMAGFVAMFPDKRIRLIMSAYRFAALIAACAALIGYFSLVPGAYDLFTEFGRARGTFKDPNVLGAFLVPALLYTFNEVMHGRRSRASLWLAATPLLLLGSLLSFSRGAWINLAVSLSVYAYFTFATAATHRSRLKLVFYTVCAALFAVGILVAAQSIPAISELMGERASFEQSYDLGPEGRFGGQEKAIGLVLQHPLGIGALEFSRAYDNEDTHEVYLAMFLNAGWAGGQIFSPGRFKKGGNDGRSGSAYCACYRCCRRLARRTIGARDRFWLDRRYSHRNRRRLDRQHLVSKPRPQPRRRSLRLNYCRHCRRSALALDCTVDQTGCGLTSRSRSKSEWAR